MNPKKKKYIYIYIYKQKPRGRAWHCLKKKIQTFCLFGLMFKDFFY